MGDNLKFDSKILGILLVLFAAVMIVSAAGAANLEKNSFKNENFAIDVPSGSDFTQGAATNIQSGDVAMDWEVLENSGNNSDDVNSITYLKDSSADKKMINDFIKDLEKNAKKLDQTNKYVVLDTKNADSSGLNFDIGNDLGSVLSFAEGIFSGKGNINFSADGNKVSLSDKGIEVSDANGHNVSVSSEGVDVSGEASSENESFDVSSDIDVNSNINNGDYAVYLKNNGGNQVIVLSGNDLDLLKSMAETAKFTGN